jgi:uncharacterized protein YjbI with pentapeptide repeats
MRNYILLMALIANTCNANTYLPQDLDKFKKTNVCINCDLSRADLRFETQNNANLSNSLLTEVDLSFSRFFNSNFNSTILVSANLYGIKAAGSTFIASNLSQADLSKGDFSSANFSDANVSGVDFSYANLARANITNEQLATVKSLNCAIMPNGTIHAPDKNSC